MYRYAHILSQAVSSGAQEVMTDIYDGKIWRDFQEYEGKPFLSESLAVGLIINVDWQCCQHLLTRNQRKSYQMYWPCGNTCR